MPQSFASLHVHFVFSTSCRAPWIDRALASRLYEYFGGILRSHGSVLVAAGGMPDHVHLLASFGREISVAEAMRGLKASSSKWIHDTFPAHRDFSWQAG